MNGTALIYRPERAEPEVLALSAPASLELLQQTVGGYIEAVPGFDTIRHSGESHKCVAFCNEEGKLDGLPFNGEATALWHASLEPPGLIQGQPGRQRLADVLVGTVIVLYGDDEFMESM